MFTVKLYQAFTHLKAASMALGTVVAAPATRQPPPTEETGQINLETEARTYLAAIDPLLQSGRLGAVLMQFPHAFHDRPDNRRHLSRVVELLPGLPLVVEFRHRSWDHQGALTFLKDLGVGFCNIDQPALGSTLPPTEHVTSRNAYIRLHGRNARNWFAREDARQETPDGRGGGSARYDYFYSMEELQPWVGRARRIAERAEDVFIIANNHYRGKGLANALMLKSTLSGRRVQAPADLIATYPDLEKAADPVRATIRDRPKQRRLF